MPYALVILPIVVATIWSGLVYSLLGIAAIVLLATIHAAHRRKKRSVISRSAVSGRADATRHLLPPISDASSEQTNPSSDQRLLITAGVTHELRTPLTILKGRLHGIEDGVIRPDEDETARLLRQVEHVLAIVNDLDALAQADMGRLTLQRREIDFAEVVGAVVADLRPLLARHEMTIVESYENVRILADPTRITQIVTNLLTNATKHSSEGGHILVDVTLGAGDVQLSVMDEGPGFSDEDQDRLFTPFWRSDATIKRAGCPGTGMGLALTAKLVAAHDGKIIAENRRDRSGACFRVSLPM